MKKTITLFITLFLATLFLNSATKVIPLQGLNKPEQQVAVDNDRMYVIEGTTIYIYSLSDFKLIKKFGKRGEGPQEFMTSPYMGPVGALWIDVESEHLLVKSLGKLSWFTKNGDFVKETKSPVPFLWMFYTHGEKYVGLKYEVGDVRYDVLAAFNEKLEEIKELDRMEDGFQLGKGMTVLKQNPVQRVYKDRLYTAWDINFQIKVYDTDFKLLFSIKHPVERLKVSEDLKKKIIEFFKTSQMTKNYYEMMKPIRFPESFPALQNLFISEDKIYAITFNSTSPDEFTDNTETLIFNLKGKFLEKVILPIKRMDPIMQYPFTIHKGKLYQLIENEDEEQFEVHITEIRKESA